ncbi:GlsB/YeaQ/YmgE family stress response membrane protein [Devosia sp. 2618]|uniref:GlsB/YeaQ/YmgE family stress response membrane protein n=1 Tax=Devosia sp. 2618 TaxID=3156454 RepID=UPI0033964CE8
MGIIGAIIIGFFAGLIAKFITPGDKKPTGFILTTVLGMVGAVLATWLGQQIGWYQSGDGAGFIASVVGAVILLLIWGQIVRQRA